MLLLLMTNGVSAFGFKMVMHLMSNSVITIKVR